MGMVINTNMSSLNAQGHLKTNRSLISRSIERLSSGLRINRAGDDAAGLSISTVLKAQIRSIDQAVRNTNDAISLLQTAEGGLEQMGSILFRMRELAEQAASGSLGSTERGYLDEEYTALKSEITRISNVTAFAGRKLLDASQSITFQVGIKNSGNDRLVLSLNNADATELGLINADCGGVISTSAAAQSALSRLDDSAIRLVSTRRGAIGAMQNRLECTLNNLNTHSKSLRAANSRIEDADFAFESAAYVKHQILIQAGTAIVSQANTHPELVLKILG